jgi:hypothetical protein
MSAVATSLASSAGFQNGTLITIVPTRTRWVTAAAATTCWNGAASPRWSVAKIVSYPRSSARRQNPAKSACDFSPNVFVENRKPFTGSTLRRKNHGPGPSVTAPESGAVNWPAGLSLHTIVTKGANRA